MNRRNEILIAALVVQVILIVLLTTLRAPAASVTGKPLFEGIKPADVIQLSIQSADGKHIDLAKRNNDWVLPGSDDFPADSTKVGAFLDKLLKVDTGRLIAQTASSHARLQVADSNFVSRVHFQPAGGITHTLLIGTSPSGGAVHVRADAGSNVYLTDAVASADASSDAASWINSAYVTFQADQVTDLAVTNRNTTLQFHKDGSNNWTMSGLSATETLDSSKVTGKATRLSLVSIVNPLGKVMKPEYGLQTPAATITITLKQQAASVKPLVLRVGAKDASANTYILASSESGYLVTVASSTFDDFVNWNGQDYLKVPPTVVPTATLAPGP